MFRRRTPRATPLRYDDGFRALIANLFSLPLFVMALLESRAASEVADMAGVLGWFCGTFMLFFLIYLVWTHRLFTRADPTEVMRIAAEQHRRGASRLSKLMGTRTAEDLGVSAAFIAILVAVLAAVVGSGQGWWWLPIIVLVTVAAAWATMMYAFALRYFRLHAAGETISFDIDEAPIFGDFVSMAVMVSSVGAMSAGTPRTRAGLDTVRTHTFLAFAFNALVVAMVVSLITGFIASA